MVAQAVVLAGGKGTRLGELTKNIPKPLLDVAGKPFLSYLLWNLKRQGIRDVVLAVGYRASIIQQSLSDGSDFGLTLHYSVEQTPLGTGGALRACDEFLDKEFLVLNGDTLFDVEYQELDAVLTRSGGTFDGVMALRTIDDVSRYGSVVMEGDRIKRLSEKGYSGHGLINGGVYLLRRHAVTRIPADTPTSLETDIFPSLVARGSLLGQAFEGYFLDIGLPETYNQAQIELPAWQQKRGS